MQGGNAEELIRDHVAKATEIAAQFPRLRARLGNAAADYGAAPEGSFEFGLRAILDGLEAELSTCHAPGGQNRCVPPHHDPEPLGGQRRGVQAPAG